MNSPSPAHCRAIVPLLTERTGQRTTIELSAARSLEVFNIAWGKEMGDDYEHLTSNISPGLEDAAVDLFFTDEVARIVDPASGLLLWSADGVPNVR